MHVVARSIRVRAAVLLSIAAAASVLGGLHMSLDGDARPVIARAQSLTPQQALERLFTSERVEADWFDPSVLAVVPIARLQSIIDAFKSSLGGYREVQPNGEGYTVVFNGGTASATIKLGDDGRIVVLLFREPRLAASGGLDQAIEKFKELPGQVSVLVLEGDGERASLKPDAALGVGSAFKLAVLAALRDQIDSGKRSWSDVVQMKSEWRSLPSGVLQSVLPGTPLTLETLAALMISISDNTAADSLLSIAGRENVEALTARNRPFLSTRELFTLKNPANGDLLTRYRAGNEAERRAVLTELPRRPLPAASVFDSGPVATDVEWFYTTRELCALMSRVQDLPAMSLNPGVATAADWARVAYKGGSEPGVLNLTTWLRAKDGRQYCVSTTWNDDAKLDEDRFFILTGALFDALK